MMQYRRGDGIPAKPDYSRDVSEWETETLRMARIDLLRKQRVKLSTWLTIISMSAALVVATVTAVWKISVFVRDYQHFREQTEEMTIEIHRIKRIENILKRVDRNTWRSGRAIMGRRRARELERPERE